MEGPGARMDSPRDVSVMERLASLEERFTNLRVQLGYTGENLQRYVKEKTKETLEFAT